MMTTTYSCKICGKQGHSANQCKYPITSYGIILYNPTTQCFLMICRKHTFGYIDFLRGNYEYTDLHHIQELFNEMTIQEKQKLIDLDFDQLSADLWWSGNQDMFSIKHKFNECKTGVLLINGLYVSIMTFIERSNSAWTTPEWEFPKGRRNYKEKDLACALREFEEETGIMRNQIQVVDNLHPFEVNFMGSNYKVYKYKFFLAFMDSTIPFADNKCVMNNFQKSEISDISWKPIHQALQALRPYNIELRTLLCHVQSTIQMCAIMSV